MCQEVLDGERRETPEGVIISTKNERTRVVLVKEYSRDV